MAFETQIWTNTCVVSGRESDSGTLSKTSKSLKVFTYVPSPATMFVTVLHKYALDHDQSWKALTQRILY